MINNLSSYLWNEENNSENEFKFTENLINLKRLQESISNSTEFW
jgi:hypothetical protein